MFTAAGKAGMLGAIASGWNVQAFCWAGGVKYGATFGGFSASGTAGTVQADIIIGSGSKGKTVTVIGLEDLNGNVLTQKTVSIQQTVNELIYSYRLEFTFTDGDTE